jgi:hypothetical protein
MALVMNGCASHFLSDMFAPGHQTNPRRAIARHANSIGTPLATIVKEFYSKWMHDEANTAGLEFTNANGSSWRGYGDSCNYVTENQENIEMQRAALSASAQLVLDTANDATKYDTCVADAGVRKLIPDTKKLWDVDELKKNKDIMPMFRSTDGQTIMMRGKQV